MDRGFLQPVARPSGLHLARELVGREEVGVVAFGAGVAAGLGPGGGVGVFRGGFGGRSAVVEVAGEDEVGCRGVETRHWRYGVLLGRRCCRCWWEERFGVVGAFFLR